MTTTTRRPWVYVPKPSTDPAKDALPPGVRMPRRQPEWRPIPGYEARYAVSTDHRVRKLERIHPNSSERRLGAFMVQRPTADGRWIVRLFSGAKVCSHFVDDLVAQAFGSQEVA